MVLRLEEHLNVTRALHRQLADMGIDLDAVSDELERQEVQKFIEHYEQLLVTLARRASELTT